MWGQPTPAVRRSHLDRKAANRRKNAAHSLT